MLLEANGHKLSEQQRVTLRQRLDELEGVEGETHAAWCMPAIQPRDAVDEFGGYRHYDPDRLAEMIVFFCTLPNMFKTKLNKMLFYADFLHCKEQALSISGSPYLAFARGPVPEHYDRLTAVLVDSGALGVGEKGGRTWTGEVLVALREADLSSFADSGEACVAVRGRHVSTQDLDRAQRAVTRRGGLQADSFGRHDFVSACDDPVAEDMKRAEQARPS